MAKKINLPELNEKAYNLCLTNPKKAFDLAQKAIVEAGVNNDEEQFAYAKATLAYSQQALGLLAESYNNAMSSLKFYLKTDNTEKIAFLYNTLGWIFYYLRNNEKRLEVNLLSLKLREAIKDKDFNSYAISLNNTGETYLRLNKPNEALKLLDKLSPHIEKLGLRLKTNILLNISEANLLLKKLTKAEKAIKQALLLAKKIDEKKDIIISLIISARINKEQGRMEICKNALIEALSIKTTEDTLDEEEQIFELLHQIYASDKNWEKAYYYHEKHSKTRNKIEKKRSSKALKGIHFKHQIKELESEKTLLYEQVKTKTKEVFDISRFPAENPNCIMRINNKGKVIYANVPAKTNFMTLFGVDLDEKVPKHISGFLDEADKSKEKLINKIVEFEGRTFAISIKKIEKNQSKVFSFLGFEEKSPVKAEDYYNIYAHEITKYQKEVNKRELALKRTMEAIKIKDNKTRTILDNALDGIILVSSDWKFLEWNKQTKKVLKIQKQKRGEYSLFDFIADTKDQNKEQFVRICNRTQKDGNSLRKEILALDSQNNILDLEVVITFADTVDGVEGIIFLKDITAQKKSEKQRKYMFEQRQLDFEIEQTVNQFIQSIFLKTTIDDVLWSLAKDCIAKMGFVDCVIYMIDETNSELVQRAAHGPKNPVKMDIYNPITISIGKGIVGAVAKTGEAEIVSDTTKDKRYIVDDDNRRSEITVPIVLGDKVIGIIDSEHPEKDFFTQKHLRILTTVSSIVANRIDKLKERRFFGYILNNLPADVVVFNSKHEYVFINPVAVKNKKTREFLIGKTDYDYCVYKKIPKKLADSRREKFDRVVQTKKTIQWEEEVTHHGGREFVLRRMSPILNENNKINYVVGYGIDITARVIAQEKREALQQQIVEINASLEKEVDQKTQENIQLSEKMVQQERLVLAGEIAGTVAHELNTPLGAIVAGSDGLKENIDDLFSNLLISCSSEQIEFAFQLNLDLSFSLFIGGRKAIKRKNEIKTALIQVYRQEEEDVKVLSDLFFKTNIPLTDKETVNRILSSQNPEKFLKLILSIGTIRALLETTVESSKRAASVIQNIKNSLSVTKGQKKEKIDLRQNISSVIKLFRHEIESIATLEVFLEEDLYIQGVDFKLFQLWTNIIKNAIYAIKEKKGDRKIIISSKREKDLAVVNIKNNGPKIPVDVQNKIFDKFYTTKEKKGSGLGLGIVKSVIESHQASITLKSSQKDTTFEFSFKLNNES